MKVILKTDVKKVGKKGYKLNLHPLALIQILNKL